MRLGRLDWAHQIIRCGWRPLWHGNANSANIFPIVRFLREGFMKSKFLWLAAAAASVFAATGFPAAAQENKPIKIGVNTAIQLQVGRDAIDAVKMAVE
jgi:hypothetical protein